MLSHSTETHKQRCCDYRVVVSDRTETHNKGVVVIGWCCHTVLKRINKGVVIPGWCCQRITSVERITSFKRQNY